MLDYGLLDFRNTTPTQSHSGVKVMEVLVLTYGCTRNQESLPCSFRG